MIQQMTYGRHGRNIHQSFQGRGIFMIKEGKVLKCTLILILYLVPIDLHCPVVFTPCGR